MGCIAIFTKNGQRNLSVLSFYEKNVKLESIKIINESLQNYMSSEMHDMMRKFHNQKEPDFNEKNGVVFGVKESGNHKHHAYNRSVVNDKEIGESSELEDIIKMTVLNLNNLELNAESKNDTEQKNLLDKRRKFALTRIRDLFDNIGHYVSAISALDTVKSQREKLSQKDFLNQFERADGYRRQLHNSLMSSMQATISYIQYNFGKINDKALEKWEEEQEDKGIELLDVQRMTFPPKVICPEHINFDDRKQITAWSVQLALSLGELKNGLSQNHESPQA